MLNYICPICKTKLEQKEKSYYCQNNHCFDISKYGYVNLLPANKKNSLFPGDNKEMIQARKEIMNKGYYKALAESISKEVKSCKSVLDCGCGTGYILDYINNNLGIQSCGLDISKFAIEIASKANKQNKFCVASSINLPFEDNSFDAVIVSFAPVYEDEIYRVLKQDGAFIRIEPNVNHLYELKQLIYDEVVLNDVKIMEYKNFLLVNKYSVDSQFSGTGLDFINLAKMTPYSKHAAKDRIDTIVKENLLKTRTSFLVEIYKKI
ncbi:MAG: methyltransferase domain-containing protein [Clostridia bacterium]|nr:methyltransferase domain-containing protein [Clostridia bacterium]